MSTNSKHLQPDRIGVPSKEGAQMQPDSTLLLDIRRSAEVLGLTVWQVRGLIANAELPIVRIGNKFYCRRTALLRWVERAEESGAA